MTLDEACRQPHIVFGISKGTRRSWKNTKHMDEKWELKNNIYLLANILSKMYLTASSTYKKRVFRFFLVKSKNAT